MPPRGLAAVLALAGCVAALTACAGPGPARPGPAELTLAGSSAPADAPDLSDASKQLAGVGSTPALPTDVSDADAAVPPAPAAPAPAAPPAPPATTTGTANRGTDRNGTNPTGTRSTSRPTTSRSTTSVTVARPTTTTTTTTEFDVTTDAAPAVAGPPLAAATTTTVPSSATTRPAPVLRGVTPSATSGNRSLLYGPGIPTAAEAEVIRLVNVERKQAGCPALAVNTLLVQVARAHSLEMTAPGGFRHNSPDGRTPFQRLTAVGYDYSVATENIAAGQPNAAAVMAAWMSSEEHKANMLDCRLTQIGVGVVNKPGSQYGTYWTQDIASPM